MLQWMFVAIFAVLISESSSQRFPGRTEKPDTTANAISIWKAMKPATLRLPMPSKKPDTTKAGLGSMGPGKSFKPFPYLPAPKYPCPPDIKCWTQWFDRDDPSGTGDWEILTSLRNEYPGRICPNPEDIEVMTLSGQSVADAGELIYKMDTDTGFVCRNEDQSDKFCEDYKVRFSCSHPYCAGVCWTKWYDRDNPSATGDWELLTNLWNENPGQICETPLYIEVVTTGSPTPASNTGQEFYVFNPTEGFACRNEDQKVGQCRDYRVRFGCPC